jgi:hypothetical protein
MAAKRRSEYAGVDSLDDELRAACARDTRVVGEGAWLDDRAVIDETNAPAQALFRAGPLREDTAWGRCKGVSATQSHGLHNLVGLAAHQDDVRLASRLLQRYGRHVDPPSQLPEAIVVERIRSDAHARARLDPSPGRYARQSPTSAAACCHCASSRSKREGITLARRDATITRRNQLGLPIVRRTRRSPSPRRRAAPTRECFTQAARRAARKYRSPRRPRRRKSSTLQACTPAAKGQTAQRAASCFASFAVSRFAGCASLVLTMLEQQRRLQQAAEAAAAATCCSCHHLCSTQLLSSSTVAAASLCRSRVIVESPRPVDTSQKSLRLNRLSR